MIYYKKKIQQDVGATAVEYGILSALIAVVTIVALQATGTKLGTTYCTIANQLSQAVGAGATASGCSAPPSSGSSGSSADGSGSSADSSSSDSSGSSDSSSDGSGSDSSASSSTPAKYNASNSYSVGDTQEKYDNLIGMMNHIQSMTGIYYAQGNPITTPEEYAASLGVSAESYNKMANILNGTNPNRNSYNLNTTQGEQDYQNAFQQAQDAEIPELKSEIAAAGTSYYIPDPKNVTFTGLVMGVSQTAKYIGSDTGSYNYTNSNGTIGKSEELISPTRN